MAAGESLPPPDRERSPYTGWTRAHWESIFARITYGCVLASDRSGSPARMLYPGDLRNQPDSVDGLESFARIAPAWAGWLSHPANPSVIQYAGRQIDLAALLCQGLVEGTDPDSPHTYWGEMDHLSQHIVEAADLAVAIWLSRERVFDRLSSREQAQVMAWLAKVDGKQTYFDNWILFPAIAMIVRRQLGYPVSVRELDTRLDEVARFYRGDGWYADGPGSEFDLYNAWMFGWHFLLWAWIDGERRLELREQVLRRARSFLAGFQHFFGANGSYPAWGRSIVYRFSAISCFATGHRLGIAPGTPGLLRRISSGCLRYFYDRQLLDPEEHFIRQGYHGAFPQAGESYISPGSPYWACHGLFALSFDRQDPFWTEVEAPLPVEQADFDLALPGPGFMLHGDRSTGQVLLLNSQSGPADEALPDAGSPPVSSELELAVRYGPRHDYPAKYGKFAYSTHFPFNVAPIPGSYVPDAMLALSAGGKFGHRGATRESGMAPGMTWCEFDETLSQQPQKIRAAVLLWTDVQVRLAWIQPTLPVRAVEGPGALGCDRPAGIVRRSDPEHGWEYAEVDGRAVAIRRLLGYDAQHPSAPFEGFSQVNLAYRYAELPLVSETRASAAPRALAAASLVRPALFDPGAELANIHVTALAAGQFRVDLPDGEAAWVDLSDTPPDSVQLHGCQLEGSGLRLARLSADASRIQALGLLRAAGIVELERPGILDLRREPSGGAWITADTGLSLSPGWLGGGLQRVAVQAVDGTWVDISAVCPGGRISQPVVAEWAAKNERMLVTFRVQA